MTTFARARIDDSLPIVECIYNRELMVPVKTDQLFFVMSEEVHEKFDVRSDLGEVLIYSPVFEEDYGCMWVGLSIDFEFLQLEGVNA
jgi:hypothetical protein